jgi:hypothetical protein
MSTCQVFKIDSKVSETDDKLMKICDKYQKKEKSLAKTFDPNMTQQKRTKYFKDLKTLKDNEQKEELLEIKKDLLDTVKPKDVKDGDLIEDVAESGYRTNGVYIISKKGETIEVLDLGRYYDDYGYVDGDFFSLSKEKESGYWDHAPFTYAYWNKDDLPEPISVQYWKNPSPEKISTDSSTGKSVLDIGWIKLVFPCSEDRLLYFLRKAQKQVKALYFFSSDTDYVNIDDEMMPSELEEILLGITPMQQEKTQQKAQEQSKQKLQQKKEEKKVPSSKKNRPSPSQSATLFQVGFVKQGNDGNMYQVKQNKNKVKRWVKMKHSQKPVQKTVQKPVQKSAQKPVQKPVQKTKSCPPDKILNPATKRCVSKSSKVGKNLSKK